MQVKDYLNDLLGKIEACPYIESQNIACEEYPPDAVYINGQVIFTNGSRLIYKEFIVFGTGREKILKYAYNYIAKDNTLIFRYDNALDPKARKLPIYPEHKHTQKELLPIVRPAFKNVIREISSLIEETGT